ncbi:Carbohydrate binding domain-containing protein [Flavobacterium resistens]|uniref:endo-1,4-beta-xylanase n=1 Tax=Flavobacterium resistens TaxID=443612 RepID=A0A521AVK6_9FLAO|nr:endo-1,4-beta-xylanase [Flavobacterium resistens]MRX68556.1 glycosyl hydrolase family 10 [Flavobacterium resistens]SMO38610.1 Carbohydrate binding domain-containing protein [Flavobacterium resistens]
MKYKNILPIAALSLMFLSSCDDNLMDWEKDPEHGAVTGAELPLELVEKIGRYEPLKNYTNFVLGNGIGADLYMSDAAYRKIVNENFDEVTPGYAMKHGAMVNSKGEINFATIDAFIAETKKAGLKVFGHTLVWHSNQNASYLNSIIAPTVIPGSSGTNILDIAGLKSGAFTNWARNNPGKGISVVANSGLTSTSQAVQLQSSATSSAAYNLQLTSPNVPINAAHNYEISFYIKSDVAGKGRLSFNASLTNQYPYKDWYATGGSWTEAFATTSSWQQVKIKLAPGDFKAGSTTFQFNIDLGYLPNVTYLIDVNTLAVVDLDAPVGVTNLVSNGKFNTDINGWSKYNGATDALSLAGAANAYEGNGAMKVVNATSDAANQWKTQIHSDFTSTLTLDKDYTISFMIRSEATGSVRCSTTGTTAHYQGDQATSPTWKLIEWKFKGNGTETGLNFDLGGTAGTYYIDNVVVSDGSSSGGATPPVNIDKTDAEKTIIIGNAMADWITKMMAHYKTSVFAWDVVNEPMKEDGTLRNGTEGDTATDYFSWIKYLGKDYAVTAFKLARTNGNATDKLFINDYNLESRLDKCDGLIEYVKYIESKGATVDGIGTQMHISLTTDKDKIVQMFQKLAASGKLIKISELDIRLGTATPTVEQQASQAAMYQYVIDMYKKYIPAAQQYGITIWGVSDSVKEHEFWLPNESPNLWDANYVRKHAYKGTADGLAGKDVSTGFSGELVKK